MIKGVKEMTAELIRDANSLVFLELAEVLRAQGHIGAAKSVALTGIERHPELPEAHDVHARILVTANEPEGAWKTWKKALELNPRHIGAHKGLGFLLYSQANLDAARDHLEQALAADPTNQSVIQALKAVRKAAGAAEEPPDSTASAVPAEGSPAAGAETETEVMQDASPPTSGVEPREHESRVLFASFESGDHGILLVDTRGRTLAGEFQTTDGRDRSDEAAAHLAVVSEEMERTGRMLNIGKWQWLVVEATEGNLHVTQPVEEALLLIARNRDVPVARLGLLAESAGAKAKTWLEEHRR